MSDLSSSTVYGDLTVTRNANIKGELTVPSVIGNASTATKLATARTINGVSFDGTQNITIADSTKEPIIAAGTTTQYWRGDKSWQTLNKAAVGLSNVTNDAQVKLSIVTTANDFIVATGNAAVTRKTPAEVRAILNVADGADVHPSQTAITSNNSNGTVLQDISVNTLGHVTSVGVANLDNRYLRLVGGTLTGDLSIEKVTPNLTIKNTSGTDVSVILDRNVNANWKILSAGGNLMFQNDYTTTKVAYYDVLTLNYNSGNASFKGTVTAPTFSGSLSGNASTSSKWATARAITLGGDLSGNVSIDGSANVTLTATVLDDSHSHSNYLPLAGGTMTGSLYTPNVRMKNSEWAHYTTPPVADMGFIDEAWTNKLEFFPVGNIVVEKSSDGSAWNTTSEYTDSILRDLVGGDSNASFKVPNLGANGTGYVRLTFNVYTYVYLECLYIYSTKVTGSFLRVKVEKYNTASTAWETVKDYTEISGWPSHHSMFHPSIPWSSSGTQYSKVRLTFHGETTNPSYLNHFINKIKWFGGYPNGKRNLYSTDSSQNASFPASVSVNQLTSRVSTNTPPLVVTSTTKVANLNTDYLDDMHATSDNTVSTVVARDASGNFSAGVITASGLTTGSVVGTGSPRKVQVQDWLNATQNLSVNCASPSYNLHINGTAYTSGSTILAATSNNVLIGTTTDDATNKLQVNGSAKIIGSINFDDVSRYWLATNTNWGIYWNTTDNKIEFRGGGTVRGSIDLDNGQIASATATGTAPFTVASTTKVANLNVDRVDDLHASSFLRSDADDTFTGKLSVGSTSNRSAGMYGTYDSYKIGHVWSMGTEYSIPNDGSNFGNLYGIAYKHTNNTTGGTMAGGHQIVFCSNGTPGVALGMAGNIWTSGTVTWSGGGSANANSAYSHISSNGTSHTYINQDVRTSANVSFNSMGVNQTDGTGKGISLYNGNTGNTAPTYGIMFAKTSGFGTHGGVTSDWATYLTMSNDGTRGWIFRKGTTNVASISGNGYISAVQYLVGTTRKDANWDAAYTHKSSTGADHSYINQSVTTSATVQFAKIGVGTSSPSESLDVVGSVKSSTGFKTGSFSIVPNSTEGSLDFVWIG